MKDAYYFSHDSNAHNDPKILSMICDYGMAGYGQFWVLIENLREQDEFKLKHDKSTWKALSMQMQCTVDAVKKYIEDCVYEYALLEMSEDLYFSSNSLNRRMDKYLTAKEKRAAAANKRWNNAKDMQSICNEDASDMQSNAKESKVKESKYIYSAFFEEIWLLYPNKKGKGQVRDSQKLKLHSIGLDHLKRCIERYIQTKPSWQQYQNGSTFFNSGYVDYLDENFKTVQLVAGDHYRKED